MEVWIMGRRKTTSRAKQRQEMLRELAAEEAVCVTIGKGYSRATEAVDALRRIRDGTYGICADCGKRIPAARLQAKPEATRCVACQTEYERRSAAQAGDWNHVVARSA
jgi:RNA polymerase-binding transcription factor DksA